MEKNGRGETTRHADKPGKIVHQLGLTFHKNPCIIFYELGSTKPVYRPCLLCLDGKGK